MRIEEAKENLKKCIRLPTEEKIKKIIDKNKNILEKEFDKGIEEKLKVLKPSDKLKKQVKDIIKGLEVRIKKWIEEELKGSLKKKAFEEGKHQTPIRTTLFEGKIAKLEAQKEGKKNPSDNKILSVSLQYKY